MCQSQGFKYFEKTDPDPGGNVSDMVERQSGRKAVHRVFPMVDAKIPSLAAGAAGHAADSQPAGSLRRENARILESILKSPVIGVNPFKKGDLGLKSFILPEKGFDHGFGEACRDTSGDNRIKEETVAEKGQVDAMHGFPEGVKEGEGDSEARIISESPQVGQMIGDSLPLQQKGPDKSDPLRDLDIHGLFDGL